MIGVRLVVRDAESFDDLGVCTAPAPVEAGDMIAFAHGPPLRVASVLPTPAGGTLVPVLARPAQLAIASR